jgi:hypothetical protein
MSPEEWTSYMDQPYTHIATEASIFILETSEPPDPYIEW